MDFQKLKERHMNAENKDDEGHLSTKFDNHKTTGFEWRYVLYRLLPESVSNLCLNKEV